MAESQTKTVRAVKNAAHENTDKATASVNRTAHKAVDAAFQFPTEVPEMFRSMSEQGLSQTRETYARVKAAAEEATDVLEETFSTTRDGLLQVHFQAIDVAKANADATFDFFKKLLGVNSVSDAIELQTSFARERFEAFVDYSKDVQATISKVGAEASRPAKVLLDRTLSQSKAA